MSNDGPRGPQTRLASALVVFVTALLVTAPLAGAVSATATSNQGDEHQFAPLAGFLGGASAQQEVQQIDSCTDITNSGQYELAGDIRDESAEVCIHVRASDVELDGNGHTIAGNETNDSIGVLVYNATPGAPVERNDSLASVTVQNLTVAEWENGVVVGDIAGIDTSAEVRNVDARNNTQSGVKLTEVTGGQMENVTATGNQMGFSFWEVSYVTAQNVTATGNARVGLGLFQNVENNTFSDVTATENGPEGYASAGIYLSTDAVNNIIEDSYVADNDGPGIRFSDSFENSLRNVVVESNANRGIFGTHLNGEHLQNVTVRDNGGSEVELSDGGVDADDLHLGAVASLSFQDEPVVLEPFDSSELASNPPGNQPADQGVEVINMRDEVTLTFDYDADAANVRLWRYDGDTWVHVSNAEVDEAANTITGTVTGSGQVIPVETETQSSSSNDGDNGEPGNDAGNGEPSNDAGNGGAGDGESSGGGPPADDTGSESQGETTEESASADGTGVSGTDAPFVIQSLHEDADFDYEFVVDGSVEPHTTTDVSADSGDRITENDDGSVTVTGSTGDASGDAFLVSGEVTEFSITGVDSGYALTFDGENVTSTLTADDTSVRGSDGAATAAVPTDGLMDIAVLVSGADPVFCEVVDRLTGS